MSDAEPERITWATNLPKPEWIRRKAAQIAREKKVDMHRATEYAAMSYQEMMHTLSLEDFERPTQVGDTAYYD